MIFKGRRQTKYRKCKHKEFRFLQWLDEDKKFCQYYCINCMVMPIKANDFNWKETQELIKEKYKDWQIKNKTKTACYKH